MSDHMAHNDDKDRQREINRVPAEEYSLQQDLAARSEYKPQQEPALDSNTIQMPVVEMLNSELGRDMDIYQRSQLQQYGGSLPQMCNDLQEVQGLLCAQSREQRYRGFNAYSSDDLQPSFQIQSSSAVTQHHNVNHQYSNALHNSPCMSAQTAPQHHLSVQHSQSHQQYSNLHRGSRIVTTQQCQITPKPQLQGNLQMQIIAQPQNSLQSQGIQKSPSPRQIQQHPEILQQQRMLSYYDSNTILESENSNTTPDLTKLLSLCSNSDLFSLQNAPNPQEQRHQPLDLGASRAQGQHPQKNAPQVATDAQGQGSTFHHQPPQRRKFHALQSRSHGVHADTHVQKTSRDQQVDQPTPQTQQHHQPRAIPGGGGLLEETNHEVLNGPFSATFMKKKPSVAPTDSVQYKVIVSSAWLVVPNSNFSNQIIPVLPRLKYHHFSLQELEVKQAPYQRH